MTSVYSVLQYMANYVILVACQCNGHSSQCDVLSGICSGCQDNTEGSYCQSCSNGFFGDATRGTAADCQPCLCPGTTPSSSFSDTCEQTQDGTARWVVSEQHISWFLSVTVGCRCTNCDEGHGGDKCGLCIDGYFGDPMGSLGSPRPCVKCDCSGNVNESTRDNCNNLTGICSQCLYNTTGDHCELCAPGYYGNALAKNCTGTLHFLPSDSSSLRIVLY